VAFIFFMAVLGVFGWFVTEEFPQFKFWESVEAQSLEDQRKNNPGEAIFGPEGAIIKPSPDAIKPKYRYAIPLKKAENVTINKFMAFNFAKDPTTVYKASVRSSHATFERDLQAIFSWLDFEQQLSFAIPDNFGSTNRDKWRNEAMKGQRTLTLHQRFRGRSKCNNTDLMTLMRIKILYVLAETDKTERNRDSKLQLHTWNLSKMVSYFNKLLYTEKDCYYEMRKLETKRILWMRYPTDPTKNIYLKKALESINKGLPSSDQMRFVDLPLHVYKTLTFRDGEFSNPEWHTGPIDPKNNKPMIFNKTGKPVIGEFTQNGTGNCWWVSMLNAFADAHPNIVAKMVRHSQYPGFAEVDLYPLGFKEKILVDYTLPGFKFDGSRPNTYGWGLLIEKAYVKHISLKAVKNGRFKKTDDIFKAKELKDGWEFMSSGNGVESWPLLTGQPAWAHRVEDGFPALKALLKKGYCATAGFNGHDWTIDRRTLTKNDGNVWLHEPNNSPRSSYTKEYVRDGVDLKFPNATFVQDGATKTGLFKVSWANFKKWMASDRDKNGPKQLPNGKKVDLNSMESGNITVGSYGFYEIAKENGKEIQYQTDRLGSAQGDVWIFTVSRKTKEDEICFSSFQETRRWAEREFVIKGYNNDGKSWGDKKLYHGSMGWSVERPYDQDGSNPAAKEGKNVKDDYQPSFSPVSGPAWFGCDKSRHFTEWTSSWGGRITGKTKTKGSMVFYPGYKYFWVPTRKAERRANVQIYTKKGCGLKLSVTKAEHRAFKVPFNQAGKGIAIKTKRSGGYLCVKVQQDPLREAESKFKQQQGNSAKFLEVDKMQKMHYDFIMPGIRKSSSQDPRQEQKVHFKYLAKNGTITVKCNQPMKPRSNVRDTKNPSVEIGVWWDPTITPTSGIQITQM